MGRWLDPIFKLVTWILITIAWISLRTSHNWLKNYYYSTLLITCGYWVFLTVATPVVIFVTIRDNSWINEGVLFGLNLGNTITFGLITFINACQVAGFYNDTGAKDSLIYTANAFMFLGGFVAMA